MTVNSVFSLLFYIFDSLFIQVPATVDPETHTVTGTTSHFCIFTTFHIPTWNNLFSTPMNFGTQPPQGEPWEVTFSHTTLRTGAARWFNSGTEFPAGSYRITALGDYNLNPVSTSGSWWLTGAMKAWETYIFDGIWVLSGTESSPTAENPISFFTVDHYEGSGSTQSAIIPYTHPSGKLGMRIQEQPWTSNNNYGNLGYWLEYTGDTNIDDDGDGLNDTLETTGILSAFGKCYTNPNNPDTDGDGLIDGMEVGELMVDPGTGIQYFKALSNPTKAHSDNDGISDYDKYELGTNPILEDTDHDGINDNIDENPLSYDNNKKPGMSDLEIGRAIVLGAVFGEMGCENGLAAGYVDPEISSSVYYLIGWIGFSFIPGAGAAACARDAVQYYLEGKTLQAALNLVGVFPLLSTFKVEGAVAKFIAKNPGKEAEIAGVVVEDALKLAPDGLKAAILKAIDNATVVALLAKNVPVDAIASFVKRGIKLSKVDQTVVLDSENAIPVLKDSLDYGVDHYIGRHVTGELKVGEPGTTLFPTNNPVIWTTNGNTFPYPGTSTFTQSQIKQKIPEWIDQAIQGKKSTWGNKWPTQKKTAMLTLDPTEAAAYGIKEIEVVIYGDSGVKTVYPTKGSQVYRWINGQWSGPIIN